MIENFEEYKKILNNITEVVVICDFKGKIIYTNKRGLELFKIKKEDVYKENVLTFIDPEFRKLAVKDLFNVLRGKEGYFSEYKARDKKGRKLWVEAIGKKIVFQGKKVLLATLRDITEKKELEEKIQQSERKYQELYQSIRDGIVMVNMQGRVIQCNKAYLEMTGYGPEEIKKLTYKKLTPPRWYKMEANIVKNQVLKRGYSDLYEKQYIRKDGRVIDIQLLTWLIKDDQGKPQGMWAIVRDITEKKRSERKTRESEEQLKVVLDNVPIHVAIVDENRKFILWNKYSEKIFGYKPSEAIGKLTPYELHTSREEADKVVNIAARKGIFEGEVEFRRKNGQIFPAKLTVIPRKENNKIKGFYGIAYDISKDKEIMNKIEQHAQELERMNNLMIGRELKMIELKKKIRKLEKKLAQKNGR